MGTIYCGPFADQLDEHEGYAARIRPDGSETSTYTHETRETVGYRARCSCGWRGTATHPATEAGEQAADDDWDREHLRPLVRSVAEQVTVPATRLLDLLADLRATLQTTVDGNGEEVLTERSRGVVDVAESLADMLDAVAEMQTERAL